MPQIARTEPTLTEWAVLGLLRERPAHGWDIARSFASDGEIGQVWTVSRPLVYRAITVLRELGYVVERGSTRSTTGPHRVLLAPTPRGRQALRRWLARPTEHIRDLRSELLVKLLLLSRAGSDQSALLHAQLAVLDRGEIALAARVAEAQRLRTDRRRLATLDRDALHAPSSKRSSMSAAVDPSTTKRSDTFSSIARIARRDAAATGSRCLGPVANRPHRAAPRLPRRPRRLLTRLGDRAPARIRRLGRHRRPLPRRPTPRNLRDPLTAPPQPDLASRSARSSQSRPMAFSSKASTFSTALPCSIIKPYVPLFDTPDGPVSAGWFSERAKADLRADLRQQIQAT